tara:strand:- start:26517 stop:26675 length:159 start_codon:yes stop_codon:yes gene_type:complete
MSADLIILPYEQNNYFMYAIYNTETKQYLTLYSTKEKAQNDLDYILEKRKNS